MDENINSSGLLTDTYRQKSIHIRTDPMSDSYTIESRPFARGKFATVRRCQHKATGTAYAAKHIRKRRRAADARHEIMHEIHVLDMSTGHPHIVQLHEVFETPSEIILVLEMVSGGELQRVLDDEEVLDEHQASKIMRQILNGLSYLHEHRIAHLDLKPQNLLLTQPFPNCEVKLCDFGISRLISKGIEIREIVGTPDYVAPEILHYEPISLPTDMWSIGILTYVLLSGHSPFGGDTKQETFCNITHGALEFPADLFENVSNTAKDFIQRLLLREPSERMTAKECLSHSWLNQDEATNQNLSSQSFQDNISSQHSNSESPSIHKGLDLGSSSLLKEGIQFTSPHCDKKQDPEVKSTSINKKDNFVNKTTKRQMGRHSVDMMVAELEGLNVTKIFSEELIKDERIAVVF